MANRRKMMNQRNLVGVMRLILPVALLALQALVGGAFAADYPARPIKLVVPYAPGGGTDLVGFDRRVATLEADLNLVVDTRDVKGAASSGFYLDAFAGRVPHFGSY